MTATDLITVDPDILGGTPVFKGTRVPVRSLFDYPAVTSFRGTCFSNNVFNFELSIAHGTRTEGSVS